jgi:sodium/hydrogen antiporter
VIVIEESRLPHEHLIVLAIYVTVGLSVIVHGLTAAPLATRYARWYERHPPTHHGMESADAKVTRPRRAAAALERRRRAHTATPPRA